MYIINVHANINDMLTFMEHHDEENQPQYFQI